MYTQDQARYSTRAFEAQKHAKITELRQEVQTQLDALKPPNSAQVLAALCLTLHQLIPLLAVILTQFEAFIATSMKLREKSLEYLRYEQVRKGVLRHIREPNIAASIFLIMAFWLAEGCITGAMMTLEGKMLVFEGFTYGLIFAGINVLVGLLTGFLSLRPAIARLQRPDKHGLDYLGLFVSWSGVAIGICALAVLIFSAARVRALGGHHEIFSFEHVSLLGTFDDAITLMIVVLGIASSLISIREGFSGFTDPVPGLSEAAKSASERINDQVDEGTEAALDQIADQFDDLIEEAEDALEDSKKEIAAYEKAVLSANQSIRELNAFIDRARREVVLQFETRQGLEEQITLRAPPDHLRPSEDLFEELKLAELSIPATGNTEPPEARELQTLIGRLRAERAKTEADIEAKRSGFFASIPLINLFPET